MDGAGANMCKAVNIEGVAVKATFVSRVCVGDSDDSDNEGGLGNVERVVMRPPGHSGKAKRGHLCFDASFETGNLGRVDFITENEYDLFIRPDTCNPRVRFWFHFTVDNVQEDQRVIFNIVNLSRTRNLFQQGMTPVVRSTSRRMWKRLPSNYVYYHSSPEHSDNIVLSFAFAFDRVEGEKYDFALTFPYSYSRCRQVEQLLAKRDKYVACEPFVQSTQNRQVSLVTITDNVEADITEGKRVVIVIARSHPGEPLSSYVVQGMMEFLSSEHGIAADLRGKLVFKIFPMLNPDGVYLGNSRCTLLGSDLNRCWQSTSKFHHPILYSVKNYILNLSKKHTIDFVIDLHCSSSLLGVFIQGNSYDSVYRNERHSVFPKMMAQNCPDFVLGHTMYNSDPEKEGTARRSLGQVLADTTNVYSLEVSMFGQFNPIKKCVVPYTEENYSLHGRRICRALWDYFKVMNVINDSNYKPANLDSNDGAGLGEAGFSMVRLKEIAKQREIFSSVESLSNESSESDSETTKPSRLTSKKSEQCDSSGDSSTEETSTSKTRRKKFSRRRTNSSLPSDNTSLSSSIREFIHENPENGFRKLDYLEYRKSVRQRQIMQSLHDAEHFKIVGKRIVRPEDQIPNKKKTMECFDTDWNWNNSVNFRQTPRYLLPHNQDPSHPRHILTISRVKLRRAANDKLKELTLDEEDDEDESAFWKVGDSNSSAFVMNRRKVVGGGGVIVQCGDAKPVSTYLEKQNISKPGLQKLDCSLHVDIKLNSSLQKPTATPNKSTRSPKVDTGPPNRRQRSKKNKNKNETIKLEIDAMTEKPF